MGCRGACPPVHRPMPLGWCLWVRQRCCCCQGHRRGHALRCAGGVQGGKRRAVHAVVLLCACRAFQLAQRLPGAHHAGHRAFVGDGQRRVTQRPGALHQLFRAAGAALKAEVSEAVQFGIGQRCRRRGGLGAGVVGWASSAADSGGLGCAIGGGRAVQIQVAIRARAVGRGGEGVHRPAVVRGARSHVAQRAGVDWRSCWRC